MSSKTVVSKGLGTWAVLGVDLVARRYRRLGTDFFCNTKYCRNAVLKRLLYTFIQHSTWKMNSLFHFQESILVSRVRELRMPHSGAVCFHMFSSSNIAAAAAPKYCPYPGCTGQPLDQRSRRCRDDSTLNCTTVTVTIITSRTPILPVVSKVDSCNRDCGSTDIGVGSTRSKKEPRRWGAGLLASMHPLYLRHPYFHLLPLDTLVRIIMSRTIHRGCIVHCLPCPQT
jgi:hypothetical protein